MADTPRDELLSAYIDGELTDAERAEVEKVLAENADARQLVSELTALNQSVGSLPSYRLNEDLAKRVLQRAERAMLTEPLDEEAKVDERETETQPATSEAAEPLSRPPLRERLSHVYLWPILAVAAAILIMVFVPDRDDRIAQVNQAEMADEVAQSPAADKASAGRPATLSAGAESVADDAAEAFEPAPDVADEMPRPSAPLEALAGQPSPAAGDESRSAVRSRREMSRLADRPTEEAAIPELEAIAEDGYAFAEADRLAVELLIVRVDVDESTMKDDSLATFFSRQGFAFDAAVPQQVAATPDAADDDKNAAAAPESANAGAVHYGVTAEDVELVYVEATADELKTTLAALSADGNHYSSVTIEPAGAVETQRDLLTWYRARGGKSSRGSDIAVRENELSDPSVAAQKKAAPSGRSPSGGVTAKERFSAESRREATANSKAASDRDKPATPDVQTEALLGLKDRLGRAQLAQIVASQAPTQRMSEDAAAGGAADATASRARRLVLPGPAVERHTATEGERNELRLFYQNARRDEAKAKGKQADGQRAAESVEKDAAKEPPAEKTEQARPGDDTPLVRTLFVFRRAKPATNAPSGADGGVSPATPDR